VEIHVSKLLKRLVTLLYGVIIVPVVSRFNLIVTSRIPVHDLSDIHVRNAKLVANRTELLKALPSHGVVAELGVNRGDFSREIIAVSAPSKLHLVDIWGDSKDDREKQKTVEGIIEKMPAESAGRIHLGFSTEVGKGFDDGYFDWIYIDTDHTYRTTIAELELYKTKVTEGGIIAGHDYARTNWLGVVRFGVIEAVHEFCVKNNWEIIYLTAEINNPSFAIRKLVARV